MNKEFGVEVLKWAIVGFAFGAGYILAKRVFDKSNVPATKDPVKKAPVRDAYEPMSAFQGVQNYGIPMNDHPSNQFQIRRMDWSTGQQY